MYYFADVGFQFASRAAATPPSPEGIDSLFSKMGLSDHKPAPDPVRFLDTDPLGSNLVRSATSPDVLANLCLCKYHVTSVPNSVKSVKFLNTHPLGSNLFRSATSPDGF